MHKYNFAYVFVCLCVLLFTVAKLPATFIAL